MTIQQQKQDDKQSGGGLKSMMDELPFDRLKGELQDAFKALGEKGLENVGSRISGATDSLNDMAENGGVMSKAATKGATALAEGENPIAGAAKGAMSGVKDKVKSAFKGGGKGNKATKSTNIIESIDVGVPIDVAYNQWTQFQDFSGFMKKVESVEQNDENKVTFKAQVFWSHRTWESTILEQVPNDKIVWRSKGQKGHVDGAVTFHELAPNMTRILVVLEYYPQGLFERTGNIWRAQGRRARLELKHFRRHVMTRTILNPDDVEGWRGEIHEGKVTRSHDEVVEEEQRDRDEEGEEQPTDESAQESEEGEEQPEDEYDESEEGEGDEEEDSEEPEDEYEEDEYEEGEEPEEGSDEEEYEEDASEEPEDEYEEGSEESEDEEEPADDEEPEAEYDEDEYDEESEGDEEEEPEDEDREEALSARRSR